MKAHRKNFKCDDLLKFPHDCFGERDYWFMFSILSIDREFFSLFGHLYLSLKIVFTPRNYASISVYIHLYYSLYFVVFRTIEKIANLMIVNTESCTPSVPIFYIHTIQPGSPLF